MKVVDIQPEQWLNFNHDEPRRGRSNPPGGMKMTTEYPIYKFGSLWVCDGPDGRFFAHTKKEAERLLRETGGAYDEQHELDNVERNLRGCGK